MLRSSDNPHRALWRLAFPLMLSNLTVPLLGAVDTAIAGHLPEVRYLGAVALGSLFFSLLYWSLAFLRMSTTGLTAQAEGAGDRTRSTEILARALLVAGALGLAVLVLRRPLIDVVVGNLGASAAVAAMAREYCFVRIWSAPAALGNLALLGWLLGCGRVGIGLALQVLINLVNAAGAVALAIGLGYGVTGLAAATAIADGVGLAAGLVAALRLVPARALWPSPAALVERTALLRLFGVNRDIFLRTLCVLAATSYFTYRGAGMGDAVLAANAVLLNFNTIMTYALDGFAYAAEALIGAAIGARDRPRLKAAIRVSMGWAVAGGVVFAAFYVIAGPDLVAMMTDLPEVRQTANAHLLWIAVWPVVGAIAFQLDGIYLGATRTAGLRNTMAVALVVFLGAVHVLVPVWGNDGLWAALMIMLAVRAVLLGAGLPALERIDLPEPAVARRAAG